MHANARTPRYHAPREQARAGGPASLPASRAAYFNPPSSPYFKLAPGKCWLGSRAELRGRRAACWLLRCCLLGTGRPRSRLLSPPNKPFQTSAPNPNAAWGPNEELGADASSALGFHASQWEAQKGIKYSSATRISTAGDPAAQRRGPRFARRPGPQTRRVLFPTPTSCKNTDAVKSLLGREKKTPRCKNERPHVCVQGLGANGFG